MPGMFNVSIVGCGEMACQYLNVYRDLDWVRVVSCVDIDLDRAQYAGKSVSASKITADFRDALVDEVDAIIINTPNHMHHLHALAAIGAGKHVLLQKPVAASLKDAEAIAKAARHSDRTIGLYMSYFDQPLMYDTKDLIAKGFLGEVVHYYARFMHRGGLISSSEALQGRRTWRAVIEETGGGCFIQLAVHYIHLFQWLSGCKITRVTGFTKNQHSPGVEGEDLACALLEMDSGALGTLDTAWCASGEEFAVHGTLGRIEYRNNRWLALASSQGAYRGHVLEYSGGLESSFDGIHGVEEQVELRPPAYGDSSNPFNQHRLFLEAARDGRPAFCSADSGVDDLRIVSAVYESARRRQAVDLVPEVSQKSR